MKKIILLLTLLLSASSFGMTAQEILDKVDYNMTPNTIKSDAEMIIYTGSKVLKKKMEMVGIGSDLAFIEFTSPKRDAGTRYLRNGDNLWMYFPSANRTMKISGHMLRQGMMGSDISYEDQTDRTTLNDQYSSKILEETDTIYKLELIARDGVEVTYERRIIEVEKDTFVLLGSYMYAKSGKLLKEMKTLKYEKIGSRYYITHLRMDDKIKKNSYTEIINTNIEVDIDIPESTFTLKNLERKN